MGLSSSAFRNFADMPLPFPHPWLGGGRSMELNFLLPDPVDVVVR